LESDEAPKAGKGFGGVSEGDDWASEEKDNEWLERSGGLGIDGEGTGEFLK